MAKEKTIFTCSECGGSSPRWLGKCPACGAWNTLIEAVVDSAPGKNRYSASQFVGLAQAQKVAAFGDVLAAAGLSIHYMDERMTTLTAERALIDGGVRREERRLHVDKLAATVILTQWLAMGGQTKA